jgi:calcium and integrin-binding protein 1
VCKSFDLFTVQVFSDNQNDMSFEDFLDMASVFSEGATRDVKSSYAFRMYDFDDDGYLGEDDLRATVRFLIGAEKSPTEKNHLTDEQVNDVRFPLTHTLFSTTAHTVHSCSLRTVGDLHSCV